MEEDLAGLVLWFLPHFGGGEGVHVKSDVLLLLRVWLQLVATAVASDLSQLVVLAAGAVMISCNQLQLRLM